MLTQKENSYVQSVAKTIQEGSRQTSLLVMYVSCRRYIVTATQL